MSCFDTTIRKFMFGPVVRMSGFVAMRMSRVVSIAPCAEEGIQGDPEMGKGIQEKVPR